MTIQDLEAAMKRCGVSAGELELKTLDDFKGDPSQPSDEVAKLRFLAFLETRNRKLHLVMEESRKMKRDPHCGTTKERNADDSESSLTKKQLTPSRTQKLMRLDERRANRAKEAEHRKSAAERRAAIEEEKAVKREQRLAQYDQEAEETAARREALAEYNAEQAQRRRQRDDQLAAARRALLHSQSSTDSNNSKAVSNVPTPPASAPTTPARTRACPSKVDERLKAARERHELQVRQSAERKAQKSSNQEDDMERLVQEEIVRQDHAGKRDAKAKHARDVRNRAMNKPTDTQSSSTPREDDPKTSNQEAVYKKPAPPPSPSQHKSIFEQSMERRRQFTSDAQESRDAASRYAQERQERLHQQLADAEQRRQQRLQDQQLLHAEQAAIRKREKEEEHQRQQKVNANHQLELQAEMQKRQERAFKNRQSILFDI